MTGPHVGLRATLNVVPYEFLFLLRLEAGNREVWRARPLFVEQPDRDVVFKPGDRLTPIHATFG